MKSQVRWVDTGRGAPFAFLPLPDAALAELGLKIGDDVEVVMTTTTFGLPQLIIRPAGRHSTVTIVVPVDDGGSDDETSGR